MLTSPIIDLIGNTPLLKLRDERIFAKAEFLNPGGSIVNQHAIMTHMRGSSASNFDPFPHGPQQIDLPQHERNSGGMT